MTLASCLYEGAVRHRRHGPVPHEFRQRLFLVYLDLDELPELFRSRWLWSSTRPALAWFRRADHLGSPQQPLADAVRELISQKTGAFPTGPIRLLTHLRYAGFVMNPISLYYCYHNSGRLEFVVAEVTNTPWGEQHCYVLDLRLQQTGRVFVATVTKQLHVSPFLSMKYNYQFRLRDPGEALMVHIENQPANVASKEETDNSPAFDATLVMHRRPISGTGLASCLIRYPLITAQVYAGIHWQAFRLWKKRIPVFSHPVTGQTEEAASSNSPQQRTEFAEVVTSDFQSTWPKRTIENATVKGSPDATDDK